MKSNVVFTRDSAAILERVRSGIPALGLFLHLHVSSDWRIICFKNSPDSEEGEGDSGLPAVLRWLENGCPPVA